MERVHRGRAAIGLLTLVLALPSLAGGRQVEQQPSLLLVTLDTTRADHLGSYGAGEGVTPRLDALAASGVRFDRAISPSPLTLPSHGSILTGLVPRRHGLRANAPFRLTGGVEGLAGLLAGRGYRTAAFVSSAVLDRVTGLDRGFEIYDDTVRIGPREAFDHRERAASQTNAGVMKRLPGLEPPFFLWVHYYDPHLPYLPPEPYRTRFAGDPYAGEIAFVDEQFGRLLAAVRARAPSLVVAVAGDHGESLGEHGEADHGIFLYQSTQHVPLILAGRGVPTGRVVHDPVGLVDVAPTLLELLGVPPPEGLDGRSLVPVIRDGARNPHRYELESWFPALTYGWAPLRGLVDGEFKLVVGTHSELYRLTADPDESTDLAAREPRRVSRLRRELRRRTSGDSVEPADADPGLVEHRRRLQSLGYLAGGGPGSSDTTIDPRRGVQWLADLEAGRSAYQSGRPAEGIEPLERLLERNPRNVAALLALARCRLGSGDADGAVAAGRQALALRPDDDLVHFNLANALATVAGTRPAAAAEARSHYRRALALNPRFVDAYLNYASLLDRSGTVGEVAALLDRARGAGVRDPEIEIRVAAISLEAGRPAEAERALIRSLELDPGSPRALEALAAICERQGRKEEAAGYRRRLLAVGEDREPRGAPTSAGHAEMTRESGIP